MTPAELAAKGLRVKPLVWVKHPSSLGTIDECAVSDAPFSHRYHVQRDPWAPSYLAMLYPRAPITDSTMWWESKGHVTIELARAAAIAHCADRIAAMIEETPHDQT